MNLTNALTCIYAASVTGWLFAMALAGDSLWWVALIGSVGANIFSPLPLLALFALGQRRKSLWLAIVVPLAAFLWLYGELFLPPLTRSPETAGPSLKVMTFNTEMANQRDAAAVLSVIEAKSPDVVAFQEFWWSVAIDVTDRLVEDYPYVATSRQPKNYGNRIFSRYPIVEASLIRLHPQTSPAISAVQASIDVKGQLVHFLTCTSPPTPSKARGR